MSSSDFLIENGVLIKYNGPGGDVVLPESVTEIGGFAFHGCTGLTSLTIPAGVTRIDGHAFHGCTNWKRVEIAPGNRRFRVEDGLLIAADGETVVFPLGRPANIVIPGSATKIGAHAFQGCTSLTSVTFPEGLTGIGGFAFFGCTGLSAVTIPSGVTDIGLYAFSGCTALEEITLLGQPKIGQEAFPDGVTAIVAQQLPLSAFLLPAHQRAAIKGFALRYTSGAELPERYRADCLTYIAEQRNSLYPAALAFPALLHVMLAEQMVPKGDLPYLLDQAVAMGEPQVTAMLLEHQNRKRNIQDPFKQFTL